jgi:hypothetical protein
MFEMLFLMATARISENDMGAEMSMPSSGGKTVPKL